MKKVIAIILSLCMLAVCVVPCMAADATENSYPYVFVHGMMGWGENNEGTNTKSYWGFSEVDNIPTYLRSKGFTVAVPTVGPMSSAWDRACEMFAQLTGTVVDYGAAHSARCGHDRYGRDYTGRAVLGDGWDMQTPVNLVSHSFGGPTVNIFASLMEYGCAEEIAASPDDCSPLFTGGHEGLVYSVSTLASPHNGSPLANLLYDTKLPVFLAAFFMNIADVGIDFMFDQYGLTKDPATGEKAKLNLKGILALYKSDDHDGYDMSLKGARALYEKFPPAEHTYYFSYSGDITEDGKLGRKVSKDFSSGVFSLTSNLIILCSGKHIGGEKIGKEWAANDGLVPVVSAKFPFSHPHTDFVENTEYETGIWYVMPTTEGGSHGYHVGGSFDTLTAFYDGLTDVVENIKK